MIEFHHLAVAELRQAQAWYRVRSPQVAERFLQRVSQAIERLMTDPESQAKIGRHDRYVRVSRFPFVLIYRIRSESDVFVIAVAHTARRTGYWRKRK